MVDVCFYFQVHQPLRLGRYGLFDIGNHSMYFDDNKNKAILEKVSKKCYLPANKVMQELVERYPAFKISYSFSGVFLEQVERWQPQVLRSFQNLVDTGNVEILDETHFHSLAFLHSKQEFREQVKMHNSKIRELFGERSRPKVFRNTELVYNNELAICAERMGYKAILAEGADHVLGWKSPNFVYKPIMANKIKLLLKNYRLSDDIAFRFSNKGWKGYPLTADKFASWVNQANGNGTNVNLFMDYETIGEHQWEDTGIFDFFRNLPGEILKNPDNGFLTCSEIADKHAAVSELDMHSPVSWADIERDLSAWQGNKMQKLALKKLYELEKDVKMTNDPEILNDWRKLQISDNFYYMCTKWFSDGDVHKYFNPYDRPHDAFVNFINVLNDLQLRIKEHDNKEHNNKEYDNEEYDNEEHNHNINHVENEIIAIHGGNRK